MTDPSDPQRCRGPLRATEQCDLIFHEFICHAPLETSTDVRVIQVLLDHAKLESTAQIHACRNQRVACRHQPARSAGLAGLSTGETTGIAAQRLWAVPLWGSRIFRPGCRLA